MSAQALLGFLLFDLLLLAAGFGVLAALLGRLDVRTALLGVGLAFWLGAATVGLLLTFFALATGVGPRRGTVVACCLAVAAAGALCARLRRGREPGLDSPGRFGSFEAVFAAVVALVLALLFVVAYSLPLNEWDGWAFWLPKAKALALSGSLEPHTLTPFSGSDYPLLVPMLHGAAFAVADTTNETAIHLQTWILAAGFVGALWFLLRTRVAPALLWPFLAVAAVLPELDRRVLQVDGDYPSIFAFVLGTVALVLWVESGANGRRAGWALGTAVVLLAAAAGAKREGAIYLVAAFAGAFAATASDWRRRWAPLFYALGIGLATLLPWRAWIASHEIVADSPSPRGVVSEAASEDGSRLMTGLTSVLDFVFRVDYWSVAPVLGLLFVGAALVARPRRLAIFATTTLTIVLLAMLWRSLWWGGEDEVEASSIPRISGAVSLLLLAVGPLLAAELLRGLELPRLLVTARRSLDRAGSNVWIGLALLPATGVLALAAARGDFRFLETAECRSAPLAGEETLVVFGRTFSFAEAQELQTRAIEVGFQNTNITPDACARLRVHVQVKNPRIGRELQAEAKTVNLHPTLESADGAP